MAVKQLGSRILQFHNVGCLRTASAFNDIKLNLLSFSKGFKTLFLNNGKMYEYIATVFPLDEAKAL